MADNNHVNRERLVAPSVRSEKAAKQLLGQMRESGSERILPRRVWRTAVSLPAVIAAESS